METAFRSRLSEVQKALGERIRTRRIDRGWSRQCDFARACRLHKNYTGELERGEANVTLATILAIARKLKMEVADLFDGIA